MARHNKKTPIGQSSGWFGFYWGMQILLPSPAFQQIPAQRAVQFEGRVKKAVQPQIPALEQQMAVGNLLDRIEATVRLVNDEGVSDNDLFLAGNSVEGKLVIDGKKYTLKKNVASGHDTLYTLISEEQVKTGLFKQKPKITFTFLRHQLDLDYPTVSFRSCISYKLAGVEKARANYSDAKNETDKLRCRETMNKAFALFARLDELLFSPEKVAHAVPKLEL